MTASDLILSLEPAASPADIQAVRAGLKEYNLRHAPPDGYQRLDIFLRDAEGTILGGLLGVTYWGWLTVEIFWLADRLQRKGYGSRMLRMAEAEAVKRGCHHAHLDTTDFQARGFYEKNGYHVFGILEDLPAGHQRIFLCKSLVKIEKE